MGKRCWRQRSSSCCCSRCRLPAAALAFDVTGIAFKVGMLFFAMPTSTALYVLSSQLNSDTKLASASIALSTVLSFVSLSVVLNLFF
jgi:predicted permease